MDGDTRQKDGWRGGRRGGRGGRAAAQAGGRRWVPLRFFFFFSSRFVLLCLPPCDARAHHAHTQLSSQSSASYDGVMQWARRTACMKGCGGEERKASRRSSPGGPANPPPPLPFSFPPPHLLPALDELDGHHLARRLVLHQLGNPEVAGPDVLDLYGRGEGTERRVRQEK